MEKIVSCIGVGNIGRAWAIAFSRGGCRVKLFDLDDANLKRSLSMIEDSLTDLQEAGLIKDKEPLLAHMEICSSMEDAIQGVDHVQESVIENLDVKRQIFSNMDALAASHTVLASSSSEFMSSQFVGDTANPERCLIAYPFNPPYLIPLVELSGHAGTDDAVLDRTRSLLTHIGMAPVTVKKEIKAFLLNRLQAAVVCEALHLVGEGYCTAEDLDRAMTQGLAVRWAFMGPFMTGHLNASGGYRQYMRIFGDTFKRMGADLNVTYPFGFDLTDAISDVMEKTIPTERIAEGQRWRDRRLAALAGHLARAEPFQGEGE